MTPLLAMLAGYWGLDPAQARTWGQAVGRARWSVAQEWRRTVLLFDQGMVAPLAGPQTCDAVVRFLDTAATPAKILAVLESLVQEEQLSRPDASVIENKILARVNREGQWV